MARDSRTHWLVVMLALVAALVVAGTALGGDAEDAAPLEEPLVEPTATYTPTPRPQTFGVYGYVVDTSGAPMAGATINLSLYVMNQPDTFLDSVTSASDGHFWFDWNHTMMDTGVLEIVPPPGYQAVAAQAPGGNHWYAAVWSPSRIHFAFWELTMGPFQFTVDEVSPTPDHTPAGTPSWTPAPHSENELGLPGRMWVSQDACRAGEIAQVVFDSTSAIGAGATIRFDPTKLQAVDASGIPTDRASTYWDGRGLIFSNHIDNATGTITLSIVKDMYGTQPLAEIRFLALAPGTAVLDIVDGEQQSMGSPYSWGHFGVDDGLIQIAPAPTATATPTPTNTPTPLARIIHGTVLGPAGAPVPNAALTLYRYSNTAWTQKASGTSGADGVFRLWTNPIPGDWKLVVAPPAAYAASSAALPDGVSGQVVSADTLTFELGAETGQIGAFRYVVAQGPTATPTPSPQPALPPVVLQGHVTWNGRGLAGVQVTLSGRPLAALQTTVTDDEGYYSFVVDAAGEWVVSIHDPEGRVGDASRVVDTEAWEPGPIDWGQWEGWLPWVRAGK